MPDVRVRPFLLAGVTYLVLGLVWALAGAFGSPVAAPSAHVWFLVLGWLVPSWLGLAFWYFPPFVKREIPSARVALLPVAFVHAALVAFAAASLLDRDALALRLYLALAGAGALVGGALLAFSAARGKPWRGGVPSWRREGPYHETDRLAGALAAGALAMLVLAGVLLVVRAPRGLGSAHAVVLLVGVAAQAFGAFAVFLLPRNVKRPLSEAALAVGVGALVVGNLGVLAAAASLLWPVAVRALHVGAALVAVALLPLAAFLLVQPFRGASRGGLLLGARPWLVASGAAFAAAALVAFGVAFEVTSVAVAFPVAASALLAGAGLAQAGISVLAWPVLLNATPARREWALAGALLALSGIVGVALGFSHPRVDPVWGAALISSGAAAHLAQLAPLRTPRRECPPRLDE